MKVKFIRDFRGRETNEMFYETGNIADIEPLDLVERGIVEIVVPKPVKEEVKQEVVKEVKPVIKNKVITKRATASPTKKDKTHAKNNLKSHD